MSLGIGGRLGQFRKIGIYRTKIATFAEAKELIDDYIYFYNNQRIQTKTKLTPLELRRQYVA